MSKIERESAMRRNSAYCRMTAQMSVFVVLLCIAASARSRQADLTVLDKDNLTIPDEQVSEIQSLLTIFKGKMVFVNEPHSAENNLKPVGAIISTYEKLGAPAKAQHR
jgi:hypothetical protein